MLLVGGGLRHLVSFVSLSKSSSFSPCEISMSPASYFPQPPITKKKSTHDLPLPNQIIQLPHQNIKKKTTPRVSIGPRTHNEPVLPIRINLPPGPCHGMVEAGKDGSLGVRILWMQKIEGRTIECFHIHRYSVYIYIWIIHESPVVPRRQRSIQLYKSQSMI